MNIQQLRYVVAIANNGTFREAASKLFVSQPSLSVSIKDFRSRTRVFKFLIGLPLALC
ncbi:LysR family transcriptional regulator [Streptococcus dysgalactiae]|nr:LysR family transcriptional regulator [Streptococcus dysgalactiae]